MLEVDTVIICAGQEPLSALEEPLTAAQVPTWKIGGALEALELDAKRAIDQGTRLAAKFEESPPGKVYNAPVELPARMLEWVRSNTSLLG